eukprot:3677485-Pyramimonas_sp.AAC.1
MSSGRGRSVGSAVRRPGHLPPKHALLPQWARTASFDTRLMNECGMPLTFRRQRVWKAPNLRIYALLSHK